MTKALVFVKTSPTYNTVSPVQLLTASRQVPDSGASGWFEALY